MLMYVFPPSLTFVSEHADDVTPNLSPPLGRPHIHLIKILSQRGFKYHVILLNWIKSFHIYHVFYVGI